MSEHIRTGIFALQRIFYIIILIHTKDHIKVIDGIYIQRSIE
jgi:hypothetical protein